MSYRWGVLVGSLIWVVYVVVACSLLSGCPPPPKRVVYVNAPAERPPSQVPMAGDPELAIPRPRYTIYWSCAEEMGIYLTDHIRVSSYGEISFEPINIVRHIGDERVGETITLFGYMLVDHGSQGGGKR